MAYKTHAFNHGDILYHSDMNNIISGIDESHDKNHLFDAVLNYPSVEEYTETIYSSNMFNPADTPTGSDTGCYNYYVPQGSGGNAMWIVGDPNAHIDVPPPLTSGASPIAATTAWSAGYTHYLKVKAGKTYLFKSNALINQTNESTNVSYDWGCIKYIRLDNVDGKCVWESNNYISTAHNNGNESCGMENGQTGTTYYGTSYAEIINTTLYEGVGSTYGCKAMLVKFNIDGWARVVIGSTNNNKIYGALPSGDVSDKMTETTFRTILESFQFSETTNINLPFEEYSVSNVEKKRYISRFNDVEDEIADIKSKFVEVPYYSQNLYNSEYYTNNNQYFSQPSDWNGQKYDVDGSPLTAALKTYSKGKNLCSGWVKITERGYYTIQQFNQIIDDYDGTNIGYIGLVIATLSDGTLVYQNRQYVNAGCVGSSDYIETITLITSTSSNMTEFTFNKLTDDDIYICWFMASRQDEWLNAYHFPEDGSHTVFTDEQMKEIKGGAVLSKGMGLTEYQGYSAEPIGFDYYVGAESIYGLEEELSRLSSATNSSTESITIANSDKIGFFGNSFLEGYTMEGQHPTVHLGSWLDYVIYNYSKSGDNILSTLERVENEQTQFNAPFSPKDFNLTYAVIAQQDNDGAFHALHYETYYENAKKLAKYLSGFGAKCIMGTEHDSNAFYYNMMRLAREEGYMFMDWGQLASLARPTSFKPFAHNGHPATRGHWAWLYGMKEFFDTLPRPRKAIKLFNVRDIDKDNSDLLYNTNIERAKMWQDFSSGYTYQTNPQYFDRLCESALNAMATTQKESDYMNIQAGLTATGKSKILAEIITPFTSTHLNKLKVCLNTTADKIYIKRNTSLDNPISAKKYLAFGIGENDPSVFTIGGTLSVAAGATGNVTGATIEGSYIIEGIVDSFVITTTLANSSRETSGTDILEATVDGVSISNLIGSYYYPSADYGERWNKPLCEWEEIVLDDEYCFTIDNVEDAKAYFDFDKVSFMLEDSTGANIIITDISADVSGNGEKNKDNHHKILKPIIGNSVLSELDFANSSNWTINGTVSYPDKLTYTQTSGSSAGSTYVEHYPTGTTSTIQIENNTRLTTTLNGLTRNNYTAPMVQIRILARRLPPVCFTDDDYTNHNVITPDYYPCGTLKVGLSSSSDGDCDYFGAIEVGLHWNLFIFNIPLQTDTDVLHIYSESDWMQIARIEVDQIDNYVTFS